MPILKSPPTFTHELAHARFTSLATPRRGAQETSVWRVRLEPGQPAAPHSLTREEIFVVLSGSAYVSLAGERGVARSGDAIVVPPHLEFSLTADEAGPVELLCCLPVGGKAQLADGSAFVPPWAE
jgi:quercetin dioxygenase-like cupin family protein